MVLNGFDMVWYGLIGFVFVGDIKLVYEMTRTSDEHRKSG